MRLGVIADVHANLAALERSLKLLASEGIDSIVCLGDLVGYGPDPNEVVTLIAEREIATVVGNHDLVAAGIDPLDRSGESARATLSWTQDVISDDARTFLAALPRTLEPIPGVLAAHGSIEDPWRYVRRAPDALEQIDQMTQTTGHRLLLLGHTHRQMAVDTASGAIATSGWAWARRRRQIRLSGSAFLNPGSVGQAREPRPLARCGIVDLEAGSGLLLASPYPDDICKTRLKEKGLPPEWCHPRPTLKKTIRQVGRDAQDRRFDVRRRDRGAT